MGHVVFIVLHVLAIMFGLVALVITVPLHLIYGAVRNRRQPASASADAPSPFTHVRCTECKEFVLGEAVKCKHCGATLTPQEPEFARQRRILENMEKPDRRYP